MGRKNEEEKAWNKKEEGAGRKKFLERKRGEMTRLCVLVPMRAFNGYLRSFYEDKIPRYQSRGFRGTPEFLFHADI